MIAPSARCVDDVDEGYDGGFSAEDIEELLDSLDRNQLSWNTIVAPVVMGNPERLELGDELTTSFRELHPDNARDFARATFLSDSRTLLTQVQTPTRIPTSAVAERRVLARRPDVGSCDRRRTRRFPSQP